ncbi:MAG: hypothetical protein FVQ83_04320 [Chloroflexi bacterium]|nr:hypothetical protein [Chloroflexota bacterium]
MNNLLGGLTQQPMSFITKPIIPLLIWLSLMGCSLTVETHAVETATSMLSPTTTSTPLPSPSSTHTKTPLPTNPTIILTPTPVEDEVNYVVYVQDFIFLGYLYLDLNIGIPEMVNYLDTPHSNLSDGDGGPGEASYFEFSNTADKIAYWIPSTPAKLWISDIAFENPVTIFTDIEGEYSINNDPYTRDVALLWSADDNHLIIDFKEDNNQDLIYHVDTESIEEWNYDCVWVAFSQNSGGLATWCVSSEDESEYAVIEWGGEIWSSEVEPENILVSKQEASRYNWGWSPDGQQVAYFDPNDSEDYLYIASAEGIQAQILKGAAYWHSEVFQYDSRLLEWSQDGNRLLVYARGTGNISCPEYSNFFGTGEILEDVPCWQVIDLETLEVIWSVSDLINNLSNPEAPYILNLSYDQAAISGDGQYLAISATTGGIRDLYTLNIDSKEIISYAPYAPFALGWGEEPE